MGYNANSQIYLSIRQPFLLWFILRSSSANDSKQNVARITPNLPFSNLSVSEGRKSYNKQVAVRRAFEIITSLLTLKSLCGWTIHIV